jgi:DHA3 family macrolide efflux protein-like MFS transporter
MMKNAEISTGWLRRFVPVWVAQAFSLLGSGLVQFSLVWWLAQKTDSASVLALATTAALLPEIILSPFAGALVDRWNRKRIMIFADLFVAAATAVLALIFWAGMIQHWHIYALMFARALGGVFHWPAMQASTSMMVPDEHLARVAGVNQSLRGILSIAAPPLAALLITFVPIFGILMIDIITAAIAVSVLLLIHIPQPKATIAATATTARNVLADVASGIRYLRAWPGLILLMGMACVINFVAYPTFTLMPLLVTRHFQGGAWHFSAIESVIGVGVIAGGILLGIWGGFKNRIHTTLAGLIGSGFGFLLVAIAPPNLFGMALVGMTIFGTMNVMVNGPLSALIQSKVAHEIQGRVLALIGTLTTSMGPLAMLLAAPLAERFNIQLWFWATAIAMWLVGVLGFFIPSLVNLESHAIQPVYNAQD